MIEPNNISYRDDAARVVKNGSIYYRYIFKNYKTEYDHLMNSGLYQELVNSKLLQEHEEIEIEIENSRVYKKLLPKQIPFQSYPFEWSFIQWKKAILSYLKINHIALKFGMILKDATPYNFFLTSGRAIMFDTSSFIFFNPKDNWLAYRQFCEEFLGPIALMFFSGSDWSKLTISNVRGIPLKFISKQLPIKSWFNLTILLNIHLHSQYSNKRNFKEQENRGGFTIAKIKSLQKLIYNSIIKWEEPYKYENNWSGYYENDIESFEYLEDKDINIRKWLEQIKPHSVIDLGANTGKFSFIAAEYAKRVVALESDLDCVDKIENQINKTNTNSVYALYGNISYPTPTFGLLNNEFQSIFQRGQSQLVLGLALVHHLFIINRISFKQIAEIFATFSSHYLITEFIPVSDNKVQLLIEGKLIKLDDYTEDKFLHELTNWFEVREEIKLMDSNRKLILLEKKKNDKV